MSELRSIDIINSEILDETQLASDGYTQYYSGVSVVSCTSFTRNILVNAFLNISLQDPEARISNGDIVYLFGSSDSDGYYVISEIVDQTNFIVSNFIMDSTGGTLQFFYPSGASRIGFDPTKSCIVTSTTVQGAISQLDYALCQEIQPSNGLTANEHATLRQLIHLADGVGGPFEQFVSGAYREYSGSLAFPTKVTWYTNSTKEQKIVEKIIVYNAFYIPTSITWNVYFFDGTTVAATATDTITNSGPFEQSRVRSIVDYSVDSDILTTESHASIRQLIHLADGVGGGFETFTSGMYREISPTGPFPTSIIWYDDSSKLQKIVAKYITYNAHYLPTQIVWQVYDTNGITILATATDTLTYTSGVFEASRTRIIN